MAFLRAASVATLLGAVACSFIVQSSGVQCSSNGDCAKFDAGVTLSCVQNVCVGPGGPCATNQDCITRAGGQPAICRKDTHVCANLLAPTCSTVYGDPSNDDAIILGSILSLTGSNSSSGQPETQAAQLALDEFANTVVGLPGGADGKPRPLVYVECDDASDQNTAVTSATHLVTDVGVPAILGPDWSGAVTQVINTVTIPNKVLLISPAATSATLSGISPYFWRTAPSDNIQAVPSGDSVGEIATYAGLGTIKLAILYKNDSYGTGLYNAVTSTLQINGKAVSDPANSADFLPVQYAADGSDLASGVAQIVAFQPNIIAMYGTNEVVSSGLDAIESTWPGGATPPPRPEYLLSDGGEVQEVLDAISKDTTGTLRKRIRGTVPGTNNPLFQTFSLAFKGKYGSGADIFGVAGSYDCAYLLGYAIAAIPISLPLDGTNISTGMAQMIGGSAINVGTTDMKTALTLLSGEKPISIDGASGPLHFDLNLHEAPSDIQVWCVILDGSGNPQFQYSGRSYDAATTSMVGTYSCP